MQIHEKRLEELHPYENNPRHNDSAVPYVANSIREFGFKVPIVIDGQGTIIAGHTRYKAAQELGLDTVPCIVADDLTEDQVKAFRIADNKVSEFATWDDALLDIEVQGIEIGMEGFGIFLDEVGIDDIEPIDVDEIGGTDSTVAKITCDGKSWQISHVEAALFRKHMEDYIEENGVSFGFLSEVFGD